MTSTTAFEGVSHDDLLRKIEDLEEELRMSRVLNALPETGANDAILHWQGRTRFLAERIIPVRLKPVPEESLNPERGENRIIDWPAPLANRRACWLTSAQALQE